MAGNATDGNGKARNGITGGQGKAIAQLIDAHSWLGVIISMPLFIVFWAGSIVLFHHELGLWARAPQQPISSTPVAAEALAGVIDRAVTEHGHDANEHLTVVLPHDGDPYAQLYIDQVVADEETQLDEHGHGPVAELTVDPATGRTVGSPAQFHYSDFLYQLHYDLHLPAGRYLVGIVTLFFLVIILTGIFIHARKMVKNFFAYRPRKKRTGLLDLHNVIGVTSLPFGLMYAITGLVFNLAIVFQIAFALMLYGGDQEALLEDAGFGVIEEPASGVPMDMAQSWDWVRQAEAEYGAPVEFLRFYGYGNDNAVVQVFGRLPGHFAKRYEVYYRVATGEVLMRFDDTEANAVRDGLDVIAALHFGSFAGVDLRLLFFVLGMAIAGMIVVGNLLWLDKRAKQGNVSGRGIAFVGRMTLGVCLGTGLATAAGFLAERVLPATLDGRSPLVEGIFFVLLGLATLAAYVVRNQRGYLRRALGGTGLLFAAVVLADWVLYGAVIPGLGGPVRNAVIGTQVVMALFATGCLWVSWRLGAGRGQ